MNSNITNFFQVRVQVRVQKFLFFEFEFGQNCRVFRVRVRVRSPEFNIDITEIRGAESGGKGEIAIKCNDVSKIKDIRKSWYSNESRENRKFKVVTDFG